MKVQVDQELCISCGLCVSTCPDVFSWNEDEKAKAIVTEISASQEGSVQDAAEGCPTDAIDTH